MDIIVPNLIDNKYVEGPLDCSDYFFEDFYWIPLSSIIYDAEEISEQIQWCLENCGGQFSWGHKGDGREIFQILNYGFIFQYSDDAIGFKLRWE